MRNKIKNTIIVILILVMVVSFWVITLKLNLQNGFKISNPKTGLTFEELTNEVSKILSKSPLMKKSTDEEELTAEDIAKKLAEELKNQDEFADWQTYRNEEYGFEFKYPDEWPITIFEKGDWYGGGAYPSDENSKWRVQLGTKDNDLCEGHGCYQFYFDGYNIKKYNTILNDLKSSIMMNNVEEKIINENKTIIYSEGGICENSVAFIFNTNQTLKFTGRCVESFSQLRKIFNQILSTFKFLDKSNNNLPTLE